MTVPMAEEPGNYGDYYVLAIDPESSDQPADDAESNDDYDDPILLLGALGLCLLLVICAAFSFFTRGLEPGYSVQFTGVQGLDPSQNPAVSPAFNLTVHVNNRQHIRRVCHGESNVVVYYNEASDGFKETSIGWGKLPAFCVERRSARDLGVSLSNQGVFISQRLREKMEADRQSQQMDMSVEIKPAHPEESPRPCLTLCMGKVRPVPRSSPSDAVLPAMRDGGNACITSWIINGALPLTKDIPVRQASSFLASNQ